MPLHRFEGLDGERTMVALCIEGLMDVADSVAVTSAFPPALTTAIIDTLRRGDEKGLLSEQHYLDWVSGIIWSHLVSPGHNSYHLVTHCNTWSHTSRGNIPPHLQVEVARLRKYLLDCDTQGLVALGVFCLDPLKSTPTNE